MMMMMMMMTTMILLLPLLRLRRSTIVMWTTTMIADVTPGAGNVVMHPEGAGYLHNTITVYLVRVAPDCNCSYSEDSFSGYSGSV